MAVELAQEIDISLLQPHPRNVEIYGDEDITALQQSIQESGWIKPLTVNPEYMVISGHRRYQAAKRLGYTELPVVIEKFASEEAEMERLLRENENRGKTPEQQIREGMTWEPIEEEKAKKRQGKQKDATSRKIFREVADSDVRDVIARRVGLGSGKTYEKGKEIVQYMDEALSERSDILKMTLNDESINAAHKLLKKYEQKDKDARRKQKEEEEEAVRQQELRHQRYLEAVSRAEHCQLYHCSVSELSQYVQPESIDYIITDPPYPREFLSVYDDLAAFAAYALKPGGSLIAMVGQSYLPEIMEKLGKRMSYQWMLSYLTPGGQSPQLWQRNVNTFWKPLLWYVKGEYTGQWIGDVCKSDVNQNDKRFHKWGQSESGMADIIERFTETGQLICDPFVGGGTTAIVAMEMERQFVGCDIDKTCIVTIEEIKASLVSGVTA
ncbi:MAG TPA: ParB N-terminal domain-containing protein [Ktedonobacteraceae bacterium]|jgi:ParB/RepB/Spo0J family partition protein|nr:ParB N-terminal domain-containing protein [Ktedonobacteraceae bacterium]